MMLAEHLLDRPEDTWWDDRRTVGVVETRDEILRQALIDARHDLTRRVSKDPADWSWGHVHRVAMRHQALGSDEVPEPVRWVFNEGPFPAPGSTSVVNAFSWRAAEGYGVTAGPSMRMVVDLADLDASTWVDQAGTSGHPFHPHYGDQTETWLEGGTYPWPHSREAVVEAGRDTLTLTPEE